MVIGEIMLNKKQKIIIAIGCLLLILSILFPPSSSAKGYFYGYEFITSIADGPGAVVDSLHLFIQVLVIIAVTVGGVLIASGKKLGAPKNEGAPS